MKPASFLILMWCALDDGSSFPWVNRSKNVLSCDVGYFASCDGTKVGCVMWYALDRDMLLSIGKLFGKDLSCDVACFGSWVLLPTDRMLNIQYDVVCFGGAPFHGVGLMMWYALDHDFIFFF